MLMHDIYQKDNLLCGNSVLMVIEINGILEGNSVKGFSLHTLLCFSF